MADGPVAEVLLRRLEAVDGGLDSAELAAELGVEHQAVVGAVKSLQALGEVSGSALWHLGSLTGRSLVPPGHTPWDLVRGNGSSVT